MSDDDWRKKSNKAQMACKQNADDEESSKKITMRQIELQNYCSEGVKEVS